MKPRLKFWLALSAVVALLSVLGITHAARIEAQANFASSTAVDAKAIFDDKCAKCHGKDGRAKTFRGKLIHARDLTDAGWQSSVTDERLFNSISNGRNKMPDFKKKLSEEQIDALVAYVRRFKQ